MKKVMILVIAMLVITGMAMAQWTGGSYKAGTGIPFNIDKLGAHQNGGRGCVGGHAPHSGGRGNRGVMQWNGTAYVTKAVVGDSGDEVLWGQDLGPIYNHPMNYPTSGDYAAGIT